MSTVRYIAWALIMGVVAYAGWALGNLLFTSDSDPLPYALGWVAALLFVRFLYSPPARG